MTKISSDSNSRRKDIVKYANGDIMGMGENGHRKFQTDPKDHEAFM